MAIFICVFGGNLWASPADAAKPKSSNRVLVKLRAPLARQVEAALPDAMSVSTTEVASPALRSFLARHSSTKISALYPAIVREKKRRKLSDKQLAEAMRQKFPKRSKRLRRAFNPPELSRSYVLEIDKASEKNLKEILQRLNADPHVEFAEEDKAVSASLLTNDPYLHSMGSWGQPWDDLWGIKRIGAPAAWDTTTGEGVIVAVVDTGVDYNHPDIASNVWTNVNEIPGNFVDDDNNGFIDDVHGADFIFFGNDPIDRGGHGTHVAGTIAATGDNGIGVVGVAWRAQVMPLRGLDDGGFGFDVWEANAIVYAANNGADVINNSWTGFGSSQFVTEAVDYAYNLGAVIVGAAGNNFGDDVSNYYPANLPNVIAVSAIDPFGSRAFFSNVGSKIDVAAPGVDVLSLLATNAFFGFPVPPDFQYTRFDGTSAAAPHVAGTAALILSQHPEYSSEDVRQVIRLSAISPTGGFDPNFGYGVLNAAGAAAMTDLLRVDITSPTNGTIVSESVEIIGTATGNSFLQYVLEFGQGTQPFSWTEFHVGNAPSTGTLGVFDPSIVPFDDTYTIRLRAINTSGGTFSDQVQVVVRTAAITSPPNPETFFSSANTYKAGMTIPIVGTATGAGFQNFIVEWCRESSCEIRTDGMNLTGGGLSPVSNGVLATWDTAGITEPGYYLIHLAVFRASRNADIVTRVYLHPDLTSAAWPLFLDQAPDANSGVLPVMNADGSLRLLLATPGSFSDTRGNLWTFSPDGIAQKTRLVSFGSHHQLSVAELDGLPGEEAAVADDGVIRIFHQDGSSQAFVPTVPIDTEKNLVVLEDLDGDSSPEVITVGSNFNNNSAYVYAWRSDGTLLNNFPIQVGDGNNLLRGFLNRLRLIVGDFDGGGTKEILVQEGLTNSTYTLRMFGSDGEPRSWNSPVFEGLPFAFIAADLDNDGRLETIIVNNLGLQATVHVLQPDGSERPGWPVVVTNNQLFDASHLAVGDLDHDGISEIVLSHKSEINVFRADGSPFPGAWPFAEGFPAFGVVLLADVDGNGTPDIVTTRMDFFAPRLEMLAIRADASVVKSWELTGMTGFVNAGALPSVGDFNQDGITDIGVAYNVNMPDGLTKGVVSLFSTGTPFNPAANPWPLYLQNPRNTGTFSRGSIAPSVAITSPANGANVTGSVVITATANDDLAVASVQFRIDHVNFGPADTTAPYSIAWDLSSVPLGTHVLTAMARDASGNFTMSAPVTVNVVAPPSAAFSAVALAFGEHLVGTSSGAQTVNLTNTGAVDLSIAGFSITGDFAQTNSCGSTLAPGAVCTVSIVFTPTAGGTRSGTLTLNSNISGTAPIVSLTGTGLDYGLSASPSAVTLRTGESVRINVTVQAVGGSFDLPVSLSCTGLPTESKCKFVSATVTPGSTSATVEMKLTSERNSQPLGTSTVTILGTSGSMQRSTSLQVTLER